jgi:uncharacterized protein (TIGR02757 family)
MNFIHLKEFLDKACETYNSPKFIVSDPISIPHRFSKKEDIEIAAFLAASISWGQRPTILKNASTLMSLMENCPQDFVMNSSEMELMKFRNFVHRTFNGEDCMFFLLALKHIYKNCGGLENVFTLGFQKDATIKNAIINFRDRFLETEHLSRSEKHISNPEKNSACKRINMFLRWMVRSDNKGVDFGLWKDIPPSALLCPLDVHSGNNARKYGLLTRNQNDWKAIEELTGNLRKFDANDPVKYDFALFGLGVFEKSYLCSK